jgi:glutathione peroxidase
MLRFIVLALPCVVVDAPHVVAQAQKDQTVPAALNFKMKSLEGKEVNLADYKGNVVLIVNVASECGATGQYAGLQQLYDEHKDEGLVVLGFPCNQFGGQEPGSAKDIREFCTKEYSVTFPMFAKIDVNGEAAAPLYKHLTSKASGLPQTGKIGWNFEKFLIGKDGKPVARFDTSVEPEAMQERIEQELAK